jgi:hypothetical protein
MAFVKTGTVKVTNASNVVTAESTTTDWSTVPAGAQFTINGSDVWYQVAAIPTQVDIGGTLYWQLLLSANYAQSTLPGRGYLIVWGFTAHYGLPRMDTGATNSPGIFTRAIDMIDGLLFGKQDVVAAPATSTSLGVTGQRAWDANYEYRCISTNHWERVARDHSAFP